MGEPPLRQPSGNGSLPGSPAPREEMPPVDNNSQDSPDGSAYRSPVAAMPLDAILIAVQNGPGAADAEKGDQQIFSTTGTDQFSTDPRDDPTEQSGTGEGVPPGSSSEDEKSDAKLKMTSMTHEYPGKFESFNPGSYFRDELTPPPWYTEWGWRSDFRRHIKSVPDWVWECRKDIISGLTVALAQVPEAVAFSFVAGVDPEVGLTAAWIMGVSTSIFGGRPGMISGATGAMAVLLPPVIKNPDLGIGGMFYAIIFCGVIQILVGVFGLGKLALKIIPSSVVVGFCNGLGLVILLAQVHSFQRPDYEVVEPTNMIMNNCPEPELYTLPMEGRRLSGAFDGFNVPGDRWLSPTQMGLTWMEALLAFAMCLGLPLLSKKIPAALTAVVFVTMVEHFIVRPIRDGSPGTFLVECMSGSLQGGLPVPTWSDIDFENLMHFNGTIFWGIFPTACKLAIVGLAESLMTLRLIGEETKTCGQPNRECIGQGISNVLCGCFGGMGGCAMIGQSVLNIQGGGRYRVSTFISGFFTLLILLSLNKVIALIPTAALAGVMFSVVFHTFQWKSIIDIPASFLPQRVAKRWLPKAERFSKNDALIIVVVTIVTLIFTLAEGIAIGVAIALIGFSFKSANTLTPYITVDDQDGELTKTVTIVGPLFFGTVDFFRRCFDPVNDPDRVVINCSPNTVFDSSATEAIQSLHAEYTALKKVFVVTHKTYPAGGKAADVRFFVGPASTDMEVEMNSGGESSDGASNIDPGELQSPALEGRDPKENLNFAEKVFGSGIEVRKAEQQNIDSLPDVSSVPKIR